jgi:tartrate/fumarate subfamily iron-sulfur-dependent hydro-lyase beta chain
MGMKELKTPLDERSIEGLKVGDTVYLTGYIYIMRDATLRRIFEEKVKPPEDLTGQVILFGAPSFIKEGERYSILSVGVTTSQRMEKYIPSLLSLGVRGLIGKGELSEIVTPEFRSRKALYFLFVGGAAALVTSAIERVERVWWEDLYGEALFKVKVNSLGPAFVAIDTLGNDLFLNTKRQASDNLKNLLQEI